MNEEIKRNCNSCRHGLLSRCKTLNSNEEFQRIWAQDNSGILGKASMDSFEFKERFVCDAYQCCYIQYPIEVSAINIDAKICTLGSGRIGKLVKIRPCGDEKTYLGLFLGDLPIGISVSHNDETKELSVGFMENPAIFVFDLNKIVYGQESWWGVIENEGDLQEITDSTIDNQWYVKALRQMTEREKL